VNRHEINIGVIEIRQTLSLPCKFKTPNDTRCSVSAPCKIKPRCLLPVVVQSDLRSAQSPGALRETREELAGLARQIRCSGRRSRLPYMLRPPPSCLLRPPQQPPPACSGRRSRCPACSESLCPACSGRRSRRPACSGRLGRLRPACSGRHRPACFGRLGLSLGGEPQENVSVRRTLEPKWLPSSAIFCRMSSTDFSMEYSLNLDIPNHLIL
jgi:hypothetical protein